MAYLGAAKWHSQNSAKQHGDACTEHGGVYDNMGTRAQSMAGCTTTWGRVHRAWRGVRHGDACTEHGGVYENMGTRAQSMAGCTTLTACQFDTRSELSHTNSRRPASHSTRNCKHGTQTATHKPCAAKVQVRKHVYIRGMEANAPIKGCILLIRIPPRVALNGER
eukprot:351906-Chlamydomonas_euryale.AAC.3